ncbi:MAG: hypothetical protein AAFQ13_01245 [Pseudomonadota bacterium]
MNVHPAIAALRGTTVSQRQAVAATKAAMEQAHQHWLERPDICQFRDELSRYGSGAELEACGALKSLIHDHERAACFVEALIDAALDALRTHRLGETPYRFKVSQGLATLRLLEASDATLSLTAYEPLESVQPPTSALFSDRETHEIVVSGTASGVVHTLSEAGATTSRPIALTQGDCLATRACIGARHILHVERTLLLLQLAREPQRPKPVREIALDTGVERRTASGDKSASQAVMALSVLGALKEYGALDVMHQTALNRDEDPDVRWEAVRQMLGLGAMRGLDTLETLAGREHDVLSVPALALRDRLLSTRPDLRALWKESA